MICVVLCLESYYENFVSLSISWQRHSPDLLMNENPQLSNTSSEECAGQITAANSNPFNPRFPMWNQASGISAEPRGCESAREDGSWPLRSLCSVCKDQGSPCDVGRSGAVLEGHVRTGGSSRT